MVWGICYPLGLAKRETFTQELAETISGYTPWVPFCNENTIAV